ncbi:MAG: DUF2783 domain-containing protein [Pseudomonadota bacterium]
MGEAGLSRDLGIDAPDDFYEALIEAHDGLSDDQSALLNARLIFLLANEVKDGAVLMAAVTAARSGL